MCAGLILLEQLRVHADHQSLLLCHRPVTLFDLIDYPFSELIAQDGSADVHNELLRDLRKVYVFW